MTNFDINPFFWRREHRKALLLATATGFVLGFVRGVQIASPIFGVHDCRSLVAWLLYDVCGTFAHTWFPLIVWPLLGAFACASVVYICQLLRA